MSGYLYGNDYNVNHAVGAPNDNNSGSNINSNSATSNTNHHHNAIPISTSTSRPFPLHPSSIQQQQQQQQQLHSSNDHAWEALQRNLPAINAAGLQLSASAGMGNASVNVNNSYGQPQPIGASPSAAVAAAPRTSYDPLQAAGIQLSAANLLATAAPPNTNINPQPYQTYTQSQPQTSAPGPVNCAGPGGFQTIQPVPTTQTAAGTTHTQHPYILIKPQHTNPTATATAPNNLPPGTSLHPLLFSPASLFAATTQQAVPGQVQGQQQPQSILPAAISQQQIYQSQSQSNKRSLELLPPISASGNGTVMMNEIAPSIVSSTTGPTIARGVTNRSETQKRQRGGGGGNVSQTKIPLNEELISKAAPGEKRRFERNLREQQRSSKISSQIKELRELLSECNVPFKPNKYSILLKVVEYIKQLQSRAIMLDSEHQKLITTVRQTNEMIANSGGNNSGMLSTTTGGTDNESSDTMCVENDWRHGGESNEIGSPSQDSELFFVKGIDYRSVFDQCTTALGIAALDGRILECNTEFQSLLGYTTREDLLKQSLFNLVHNHQDIFRAMAQMLKTAEEPPVACRSNSNDGDRNIDIQEGNTSTMNNDSPTIIESKDRFWTGPVTSKQNIQLSMNITLTSGDNGTPKFFSCALTNSTS